METDDLIEINSIIKAQAADNSVDRIAILHVLINESNNLIAQLQDAEKDAG